MMLERQAKRMQMVKLINVRKSFGDRLLFSIPELTVYEGDRIGLVGPNGSGKTTLLDIIAGRTAPDSGRVERRGSLAYFRQFSDEIGSAPPRALKEMGVSRLENARSASGGEKIRLRLAEALGEQRQLYLLDEPTANLDLEGIEQMKKRLQGRETLILVSHDTALMDEVCNRMIEIRDKTLYFYKGNYTAYQARREEMRNEESKAYESYVSERRRLEEAYAYKKAKAQDMRKKGKTVNASDRKAAEMNAMGRSKGKGQKHMERQAKAILSRIEQMEVKEKPREERRIRMDFSLTQPPGNRIVLRCDDLCFAYGEKRVFDGASFTLGNGEKVGLIGNNGSGKTTLMRCIERREKGIQLVPKARPGFLYQEFENLSPRHTVLEEAMERSIQKESIARAVLARLLFAAEDLRKPVAVLSGGEKMKLSLAKLLVSEANILLMDEATNYLDVPSAEALASVLAEYEGTVVFASHDSRFIDRVATDLLVVHDGKIDMFHGNLSAYRKQNASEDDSAMVERTMLEMKRTRLIAQIKYASPEEKDRLEQSYAEVLERLRRCGY